MKKLDELRSSVQELRDEIVRLSDLEDITPEDDARLTELAEELPTREAELATEVRRAEIVERARTADRPELRADYHAPNVIREANPFDLSDLRYGAPASEIRDRARRAIDKVEGLSDSHREQTEKVMRSVDRDGSVARHIVATGNPEYRSAFLKAISGESDMWTAEERAAVALVRAASLTTTAGGFAVPFTLDPTIINTGTNSVNPFRQISRVVQTTTNSWNGVTSAGVTASWDAEAAEVSDDAPTLAQPSIPVFKGAAFVPFSIEIGMDWAAMESDVRAMITRSKDDLEGLAFVSGNGTTAPQGVTVALDGTASEIAPTTAETFALADVYKLEAALDAHYRTDASFVANKVWYNAIRGFDTSGGGGLWERLGAAQPSQLLGYNAYESSDMDAVLPNAAATADNFGILFGDFSNYVIVDRIGLTVELIPHLFHTSNNLPKGQRGFYAYWRTGAEVVNANGIKMLSIPTVA